MTLITIVSIKQTKLFCLPAGFFPATRTDRESKRTDSGRVSLKQIRKLINWEQILYAEPLPVRVTFLTDDSYTLPHADLQMIPVNLRHDLSPHTSSWCQFSRRRPGLGCIKKKTLSHYTFTHSHSGIHVLLARFNHTAWSWNVWAEIWPNVVEIHVFCSFTCRWPLYSWDEDCRPADLDAFGCEKRKSCRLKSKRETKRPTTAPDSFRINKNSVLTTGWLTRVKVWCVWIHPISQSTYGSFPAW